MQSAVCSLHSHNVYGYLWLVYLFCFLVEKSTGLKHSPLSHIHRLNTPTDCIVISNRLFLLLLLLLLFLFSFILYIFCLPFLIFYVIHFVLYFLCDDGETHQPSVSLSKNFGKKKEKQFKGWRTLRDNEREKSKMFVRSCEIIESLFEQLWMDTLLLSRIRLESSEIGCCSVAPGSTASLMEILLFVRNHKL